MEEPAGTRMQVVRGFSELVYPRIHAGLPFPRKEVDLYWPAWHLDHWRCHFEVDGCPVVIINLWPAGTCNISMLDRLGITVQSFDHTLQIDGPSPVVDCFGQIGDRYASEIINHLKEATKQSG